MIMTRRFGALRARRVFPSVQEQDVQVDERHTDDVRLHEGHTPEPRESAA